ARPRPPRRIRHRTARRSGAPRANGEGRARRRPTRCGDGDRERGPRPRGMRVTRFHVVGIGGMGMSAIARLLLARGDPVRGSDRGTWPLAAALAADGATVATTFDAAT